MRLERDVRAARIEAAVHGIAPHRNLLQHLQALAVAGGIRQDDLRAIDDVRQKFVGDELVVALVVFLAIAVVGAEEILRDEHRAAGLGRPRGLADFAVEQDQRRGGLHAVAEAVDLFGVLRRP